MAPIEIIHILVVWTPFLADGFVWNILISLAAMAVGTALGAILAGRDLIAQAPTGSGKTAAFGLGLLQAVDATAIRTQALVLCPTRELADQVGKQLRKLATGIANLKLSVLCGGIPLAAGVFFPLTGWQLSPMFGAAAMSLSSVCVVSNALRLRTFKPKTAH